MPQSYKDRKPKTRLLHNCHKRANRLNIPLTITTKDFDIPKHCPLLGIRLFPGQGKSGPHSPTLDRIIPKLGYVPGNVWVVSMRANALKGNHSPEQLRRISKLLLVIASGVEKKLRK